MIGGIQTIFQKVWINLTKVAALARSVPALISMHTSNITFRSHNNWEKLAYDLMADMIEFDSELDAKFEEIYALVRKLKKRNTAVKREESITIHILPFIRN